MKQAFLICLLGAAVLTGCAAQPREPHTDAAARIGLASPSDLVSLPALSPSQKISRRESLALLQAGRYADLDARMRSFQQSYQARDLGDLELLREFGAFARTDPDLQSNLDAWVQAYPASYAAHLARGAYYFKCGIVTRGTKYIDRTPAEQIRGMQACFTKARADLQTSLPLTAMPLISYHYLIVIGMELGDRDKNRDWLEKATVLDSDSIVIRRPYMISLETRWGGSIEAMQKFLDESREAGNSTDHLRLLAQLIDQERQRAHRRPADTSFDASDVS